MLQLGTDNNLRKIRISDGEQQLWFDNALGWHASRNLGSYVFGLGYDAGLNKVGFGRFDGSTMSFHTYDFATDQIDDHASFPFDTAQYGTPSGLDFVTHNGNWRMLVSAKNRREGFGYWNYILDMDAATGEIGQFAKNKGLNEKFEDVAYDSLACRLAVGFEWGGSGVVKVSSYTPFTRPKIEQSILFPALPSTTYGDAPFVPEASADSDLPLSFQCLETSVATASNHWITIIGVGEARIVASQPGDDNFAAADPVTNLLTVVLAPAYTNRIATYNNPDLEIPQADTDLDGLDNWGEYIAGSNPTNPASTSFIIEMSGTTLHIPTLTNRLYSIESTTNLVSNHWNLFTNNIPGTGNSNEIPNTQNTTSCFYRVKVQLRE